MGLLPILEVDDTVLFSSNAIAGYIAEVTGKSHSGTTRHVAEHMMTHA